MSSLSERVASLALAKFDSLPSKCKPRLLPDGRREWTPMSAIVLVKGEQGIEEMVCISLATGTKCLPASAIPKCKGRVLHDSHAEILALRGFNCWILKEIQACLEESDYRSSYLDFVNLEAQTSLDKIPYQAPFILKSGVSIYFFTTEAPCGDASMEILMDTFSPDASTPWTVEAETASALHGRGHFSLLGYVRRKPARADAESSLSKSCTDKLAVKQFTSILSFPADLFVGKTQNAYIRSMIVYTDQYNKTGYDRAFGPSGRLAALGQVGHFFTVEPLPPEFARFDFEKGQRSNKQLQRTSKASNISTMWVRGAGSGRQDGVEILVNGVKQGFKQWDERPNKASIVSRKCLWHVGRSVSDLLAHSTTVPSAILTHYDNLQLREIQRSLLTSTYVQAKFSQLRRPFTENRKKVTDTMGHWTRNCGDGDWS